MLFLQIILSFNNKRGHTREQSWLISSLSDWQKSLLYKICIIPTNNRRLMIPVDDSGGKLNKTLRYCLLKTPHNVMRKSRSTLSS